MKDSMENKEPIFEINKKIILEMGFMYPEYVKRGGNKNKRKNIDKKILKKNKKINKRVYLDCQSK